MEMGKVSILELSYKDVDSIVHNISLTPAVKILESSDCSLLKNCLYLILLCDISTENAAYVEVDPATNYKINMKVMLEDNSVKTFTRSRRGHRYDFEVDNIPTSKIDYVIQLQKCGFNDTYFKLIKLLVSTNNTDLSTVINVIIGCKEFNEHVAKTNKLLELNDKYSAQVEMSRALLIANQSPKNEYEELIEIASRRMIEIQEIGYINQIKCLLENESTSKSYTELLSDFCIHFDKENDIRNEEYETLYQSTQLQYQKNLIEELSAQFSLVVVANEITEQLNGNDNESLEIVTNGIKKYIKGNCQLNALCYRYGAAKCVRNKNESKIDEHYNIAQRYGQALYQIINSNGINGVIGHIIELKYMCPPECSTAFKALLHEFENHILVESENDKYFCEKITCGGPLKFISLESMKNASVMKYGSLNESEDIYQMHWITFQNSEVNEVFIKYLSSLYVLCRKGRHRHVQAQINTHNPGKTTKVIAVNGLILDVNSSIVTVYFKPKTYSNEYYPEQKNEFPIKNRIEYKIIPCSKLKKFIEKNMRYERDLLEILFNNIVPNQICEVYDTEIVGTILKKCFNNLYITTIAELSKLQNNTQASSVEEHKVDNIRYSLLALICPIGSYLKLIGDALEAYNEYAMHFKKFSVPKKIPVACVPEAAVQELEDFTSISELQGFLVVIELEMNLLESKSFAPHNIQQNIIKIIKIGINTSKMLAMLDGLFDKVTNNWNGLANISVNDIDILSHWLELEDNLFCRPKEDNGFVKIEIDTPLNDIRYRILFIFLLARLFNYPLILFEDMMSTEESEYWKIKLGSIPNELKSFNQIVLVIDNKHSPEAIEEDTSTDYSDISI